MGSPSPHQVPLPFGVRTVTTPRGTHAIRRLDQLQDGACYLCSDHRRAKPVDMELAGRRPAVWHPHPHHRHTPQPRRPDAATPAGHHAPSRQRRLLLVKNSEPGRRRSVLLGRRSARSLRAFLEEASDAMQFHVRGLYTAEGRKVRACMTFHIITLLPLDGSKVRPHVTGLTSLEPLRSFWISKGRYQWGADQNASGRNWRDLQPIRAHILCIVTYIKPLPNPVGKYGKHIFLINKSTKVQLILLLEKIYRTVCLILWRWQIQQTAPHQRRSSVQSTRSAGNLSEWEGEGPDVSARAN